MVTTTVDGLGPFSFVERIHRLSLGDRGAHTGIWISPMMVPRADFDYVLATGAGVLFSKTV
jgi:hypothetical protein